MSACGVSRSHGSTAASRALLAGLWLVLSCAVACGGGDDGDGDDGGGAGQSGSAAGNGGDAGNGGRGAGNAGDGGEAGTAGEAGAGSGAAGTGGQTAGAGASGAGGEAGGFTQEGVCGQRVMATVNATAFSGTEEYYITGEEGFGEDICVVRFELTRVGDAPEGCVDPVEAEVECTWTHLVELGNPSVVTDEDGVCANSELALDAAAIAELDGSQVAYGFVAEFAGHESVTMRYDEAAGMWKGFGNGTYDEASGTFRYNRRDGLCNY